MIPRIHVTTNSFPGSFFHFLPANSNGTQMCERLPNISSFEQASNMEKYSFYEMSELVKNGTLEEIEEVSKEIGHNAPTSKSKWTLLHLASFRNRPDVSRRLTEMGCNGNFLDKDGKSPLYYCKSEEVAKILIGAGAKVNQPSILGKTPLHYACLSEATPSVVEVLLQSGAQVNVEDKFGNTPFLGACNMAYACIDEEEFQAALPKLSILIAHGADVHHTNLKGESGLHICSLHHTHEIAEILLKHGANVNAITKKHQTPLIMACSQSAALNRNEGIFATLDLLLKHAADPTIPDEQGLTPLHMLMLNHCSAMSASDIAPCVSVLVESGASLNATDNMLRTPVHYACYAAAGQHWPEVLKMLISFGADVNVQDVEGFAPVHVSVPHGPGHLSPSFPWDCMNDSEIVVKSINWNCARKHGVTLAHIVLAEKGLKLQGCEVPWDISARDGFMSTPMHYAEFSNNLTATKYLEICGLPSRADITTNNCLGESPIDCAVAALNQEMLTSLQSYGGCSVLKEVKDLPDSACELCSRFVNEDICPKPFGNREESVSVNPAEVLINPVGKMEQYLPHILHSPRTGKVLDTAEVAQICHETEGLIRQILQKIAEHDDRFQSVLIPSGSVCEKTKAGLPDEFDFMCSLHQISSSCKVIDDGSCSPGFVRFKGIEGNVYIDEFLDAEGYLVPNLVRSKFEEIVRLVLFDPDLWKSCRICSNFILPNLNQGIAHPKPSVVLEFCWNGPVYKNMVYSIDLVPVIDAGVFWPVGAVESCSPLLENIQKQCLFTMTIPRFERSVFGNEVRISFSQMESAIFGTIPEVIKDAYITAKALREVCPVLIDSEKSLLDEARHAAASLIPSYWLKMALFHELEEHGLDENCGLTVWVRRIYQRVHQCVFEDEVFPSFFMPQQDFIASKLKRRDKSFTSLEVLEKEVLACKKMCQIIQRFLSSDG